MSVAIEYVKRRPLTWAEYRFHLLAGICDAAFKGGMGLWKRHVFVTLTRGGK